MEVPLTFISKIGRCVSAALAESAKYFPNKISRCDSAALAEFAKSFLVVVAILLPWPNQQSLF